MSDNVIPGPDAWLRNARASLAPPPVVDTEAEKGKLGGDGGGPHDPGMEPRVAALEADLKEVKGSLKGLELASARIEATLASLATKADVAILSGLEGRLSKVEQAVDRTLNVAIGKAIGPWQLPMILAACVAIGLAGVALYNWLAVHPWVH